MEPSPRRKRPGKNCANDYLTETQTMYIWQNPSQYDIMYTISFACKNEYVHIMKKEWLNGFKE